MRGVPARPVENRQQAAALRCAEIDFVVFTESSGVAVQYRPGGDQEARLVRLQTVRQERNRQPQAAFVTAKKGREVASERNRQAADDDRRSLVDVGRRGFLASRLAKESN